ncbi:MAG: hypothetical protein ABF255_04660 [Planktotalea arctica]
MAQSNCINYDMAARYADLAAAFGLISIEIRLGLGGYAGSSIAHSDHRA